VFEAYWGDDENIAEDEVLARLCDDVGLDKSLFFDGIALQQIKDRLRNNTQELIDRGGFGSPTIYINETDMYFGNDRLVLMEDALERLA
jgi:2-hydroxychromene-2-carboxylate isomerase